MKKFLLFFVFFTFFAFSSRAQLIITNTQTPAELVQNVLLGTGVTVTNITFNGSAANANLVRDQAGHFLSGASTNIGINEGIILATGNTSVAIGPNTVSGSTLATLNPVQGDSDLAQLTTNTIRNKAVIEFDFVPNGQDLSFNFVFGSEEYPEFTNSNYNDVFGFFLSGPGITGPYAGGAINIALIPTTAVPITINNLNNGGSNNGPCEYCAYYVNNTSTGLNPNTGTSTIQYDGFTAVIAANATVQCGQTYHIKLAIANVGDNGLDSAVFIQANSFNTSPLNFPDDYLVSNGFAPCYGGSAEICTGLGDTVPHVWTLNGAVIPGEVLSCITVTQPGEYCAIAYPYGPACPVTDCLTVEFQSPMPINPANDLTECSTTFDLTENNAIILNGQTGYNIQYHHSQLFAENLAFPISNATSYTGYEGEIIYVSIENNNPGAGGCIQTDSFVLHINPLLCLVNPAQPPNLVVCDDVSNDGFAVFDFTPQTPIILGTNNAANYTVTYHLTLAAADGDIGAISPINAYTNISNPQTIYVRMEENAAPTSYGTTSFQLIVNALPTATISGTTTICFGNTAVITFTGTANATVNYTVDGNSAQIVLSATGTNSVTTPALTTTSVYSLVSVTNTTTTCSQTQSGTATITVIPLPTATISGTTAVCQNGASPLITFTGATGIAPYTFTYNINNGTNQTVITTAGNSVTVSAPTTTAGIFVYNLVSVSSATTPVCSQPQTGSATITVYPLPTATISGTTAVCMNGTAVITFNGTPNATVTYTINSGANQTIVLDTTGTNSITTGPLTVTTTYSLVSVSSSGTPICSQNQTGTATITINPLPTATISGTTTICSGSTAVITFTGTANATVNYTVDGNAAQIVLSATGTNTVTTPALTTTSVYSLVNVTNTTTTCSQTQSGNAIVTVIPLPTATISGTTAVCQNGASPLITFTGATGIAPYTFTYNINNGTNQTVITTAGNSVTVSAPTTTAGIFVYNLVSVSSATTPVCSQPQTGSATITVNPLPTATISGTTAVCLNDANPLITFTGATGTAPYTFFYTLNNGPVQSTTSTTVSVPTTSVGTFTYDLVSVSSATTPACSQPQTGSATVTVNTAPTITNPTPYPVCDDNNDGFSCLFDLTTKDNEITGGNSSLTVTYHETVTDSQTGANPLTSPYCNIFPGMQTLYIRVYNSGASICYSNTTLQLIVNPRPIPNPVITNYEQCDVNAPGDGVEIFNLPSKTAEIANGQTGVTVTYYVNQPDAIGQQNPLPNLYPNTSSPQQIWINISNTATGCNSVSSFNIVVNPLPTVVAPEPMYECSNGASNQALFDLSLNNGTISNGASGVTVTYYNTLSDAQNEVGAVSSTNYLGTDNEIVYVRVEYDSTGCFDTTTLELHVTQGPLAVTPQPLEYCDPNNDGFGVFNLSDATNEISGGSLPLGVTVTYHETATDAQIGANALVSPYSNINPWTQTIYVRVFYTLTGCSNYVQLQLIVNPTPEATEPADYHVCDDNYDGFGTFNLTSITSEVLGSINPTTHTVSYYTSLSNAQTPSNAITNLTNYTNQIINTQTLWIRVETTATGCFDIVTLELVVDPLPNATQPNYPQYSLCDYNAPIGYEAFDLGSQINAISLGQQGLNVTFHFSQANAVADTNALSLLYTNQSIYVQTLWVRIENASTGCFVVSTMDIRVEPLPTPIPPTQPYTLCDDNQDGLADFDLNTLTAAIVQSANYTITYHETLTDAQLGNNPLVSPYTTITPFVQFIYVRAVDPNTGCWSVIVIELNVDPSPIMPTSLPDLTNCDQDNNTQNGTTSFDLTQQTPLILAAQSTPASNYIVTYHVSQSDAQAGVPMIIPTSNYQGSNNQTIWVRIENTTTDCFNIGSFQLFVNAPLALTTPTPLSVCDNDANPNDLFTLFNLTVKDATITQGLSNYTVTYYPSYPVTATSVAIATPTAYTNTTPAVQTLGVMVTSAQGCNSYTTLDIRVLPVPVPRTDPPALTPQCDNNNPGDMVEVFNLTVNAAYIINGDPNVTLHYFATQGDAIANTNEILTPTAASVGQNVWIRVENNRVDYQGNNCYVLVEQALTVNPLPSVEQPVTLRECDDDSDGIALFTLNEMDDDVLGTTQSTSDYTVSYHLSGSEAQSGINGLPNAYTNITNPETLYVRIVNNATGCVNATGSVTLAVEQAAFATGPQFFESCDTYGDNYDGVYQLDLTSFAPAILGTQNPNVFIVSYYTNLTDAEAGTNAIPLADAQAYITDADTDQIWVKVENSSNLITPVCYAITTIDISIERYPNPVIATLNDVHTICVEWGTDIVIRPLLLDSGISNTTDYTFEWYQVGNTTPISGATGPTYLVETASVGGATRNYTVNVISNSTLACTTLSQPFEVIQSGPAVIATGTIGYTVTNAFEQSQTITITVEGYGTYQYSLDEGPRQDSNVFENVTLGNHTITVWDTEGGLVYSCDNLIIEEVQIIDYPHYFTPNGDGIHDTWNIVGLDGQADAKIYIFDRYGKLLKQISSTGQGWDGTFNGKLLPSTDYWFTVDFMETATSRQFKAHFSLKR